MTPYKRSAPHHIAATLAKLAAAGATTAAIALAIVALNPTKIEVQESQADIALLDFLPESNTQRFAASLDKLGHEPLRVYNFNGNEVYFSSAVSKKTPPELLRDYQHEFVRQGLNERIYTAKDVPSQAALNKIDPETSSPEDGEQWRNQMDVREAMLAGQIIPLYVSERGFVMNGSILDGAPNRDALVEKYKTSAESQQSRSFNNIYKGYRNIEAEWDEETRSTLVSAVWSDEAFDPKRLLSKEEGGTDEGRSGDPLVPVCMGCEQVTDIAGSGAEEGYRQQVMSSNSTISHIVEFYSRALPSRGWSESPASAMTRKMQAHQGSIDPAISITEYTHASGKNLTLQITYDHSKGKSHVVAQTSN